MEDYRLKIKQTVDKSETIKVPKQYAAVIQKCSSVSFGLKRISCTFATQDIDDKLHMPSPIWSKLGLFSERSLHVFEHDGTLHIGPLVGIFTAGFTGSLLRPVGNRSLFFAKLLEIEQSVGIHAFVFGAPHINWEKGTITGYFNMEKGWEKHEVPFPSVIYNRLPNRKTEAHEKLHLIKKKLQDEYVIPWFNPSFFDKWHIHEIIQEDSSMNRYLPDTIKNPSLHDIKKLLDSHGKIYLKPANGSLGLGIYQLFYSNEDGHYYCRFREEEQNYLRKYKKLETLFSNIQKQKNLTSYIAQQGISLIRLNRKQVDFRVHTNKNENGKWIVSAIASKVAGTGSVTTHIKSGGEIKTIDEIFPEEKIRLDIIKKIEKMVIGMSELLDKKIPGFIGEIGFDIGIDKQNKIWLFEANSKPGRSIFKHPLLKQSDLHSRQLPFHYAIYLSKESTKHPEKLFEWSQHD